MKKRILALVMMLVLAFGMVACGAESEGTFVYEAPEGFEWDDEEQCYYGPDGVCNILYSNIGNDGSFKSVTKDMLEDTYEEEYSSAFGEDIDITITKWQETTVDGYDAVLYALEYEYSGIGLLQMQIMINGTDYIHYVTFTDMQGSEYADDFEACVSTMKFEPVQE